ncbi:MAG: protease modulator HflK N-terminal domain-containing protein, partial [Pseudomonadales bacterium]|nr:protease modulator HflK N-terminal domain-containing protein [Pseudomonadales bacterium]
MAWNEPGNQKDRDPWGGKNGGGNQGPPDLDEAIRKLQSQLGKIFGGKGGSGSGPSAGKLSGGLFSIVLIVVLIGWAL